MILHNPWGLLALLAIPFIIYLHFFRDRRQVRRIGGLHLWQFAEVRLPVGRHFQKLNRNLSLLFQILAAILLSLLISGLDIPRKSNASHYTIVLDDSASMQAGIGESAADRARKTLTQWAAPKDKFTIIAAGTRPRILAGPFAGRDEMVKALGQWIPEAAGLDLENSLNLASKFLTGSEKILILTDNPEQAKPYLRNIVVNSVGRPLENAAIEFADRMRLAEGRDKIFITLRSYGSGDKTTSVKADAGGRALFSRNVTLSSDKPVNLVFETNDIRNLIRLRISSDALGADNSIELAPVTIKTVQVAIEGMSDAVEYFSRAIRIIPNTRIVTPAQADLVFTEHASLPSAARNQRVYVFPSVTDNPTSLALAQGEQIVVSQSNPLTRGLAFEGVLWPYQSGLKASPLGTLVSAGNDSLFYLHSSGENDFRRYRINLLRERSNIFRNAAWPILVQNIVEECRQALPGMTRTNYRAGEAVALRLRLDEKKMGPYQVTRNNEVMAKYEEAPEVLQDLSPGEYKLLDKERKVLAAFSVNLLASAESDLRGLKAQNANMKQLQAAAFGPVEQNRLLFFLLLLLTLILTAASWVFQDMSR